ncbi:uncharacterized protein BXZ73DRAFT_77227 [Epithele typhae]|uniref:uncharacterized protein n=1 Tax=Epithele typhae TaxID=378194 RepID=UPI0020083BF6|nr:uncharacterized protein BXZ73DRAFT_77227 [Epithele typhae]KAH9933606.1 hypothetical protein BXZ73DRAFT_77227 [Epithele typhae]
MAYTPSAASPSTSLWRPHPHHRAPIRALATKLLQELPSPGALPVDHTEAEEIQHASRLPAHGDLDWHAALPDRVKGWEEDRQMWSDWQTSLSAWLEEEEEDQWKACFDPCVCGMHLGGPKFTRSRPAVCPGSGHLCDERVPSPLLPRRVRGRHTEGAGGGTCETCVANREEEAEARAPVAEILAERAAEGDEDETTDLDDDYDDRHEYNHNDGRRADPRTIRASLGRSTAVSALGTASSPSSVSRSHQWVVAAASAILPTVYRGYIVGGHMLVGAWQHATTSAHTVSLDVHRLQGRLPAPERAFAAAALSAERVFAAAVDRKWEREHFQARACHTPSPGFTLRVHGSAKHDPDPYPWYPTRQPARVVATRGDHYSHLNSLALSSRRP